MAFPSVVSTQSTLGASSNSTSFTPGLPSGSGGLLVAFISSDGNPTLTTSSTGWIKLGQSVHSNIVVGAVFYKYATGTDTLVISSTASEQYTSIVYRISGTDLQIVGGPSNGSSTNSNPPSLSVGSTQDVLWLASRHGDSTVTASAAPSGYSDMVTQVSQGNFNGASTNVATKTSTASSEDPGTFTSATEQWVCYTVGVWELPPIEYDTVYIGPSTREERYLGIRGDAYLYRGVKAIFSYTGVGTSLEFKTSSGIVVSNGNNTATNSGGGTEFHPANTLNSLPSGAHYIEVTITNIDVNDSTFGIGLSAGDKAEGTNDVTLYGPEDSGGGYLVVNGSVVGRFEAGQYWADGDIIAMAYDTVAQTVMFKRNAGSWTSTISTASVGTSLKPWVNLVRNADSTTINGGESAFAYTPLSGYTGPEISSGGGGGGDLPLPTNHYPVSSRTHVSITLSNNNKTATSISSSNIRMTISDNPIPLGKVYAELTVNLSNNGVGGGIGFGLTTSTAATSYSDFQLGCGAYSFNSGSQGNTYIGNGTGVELFGTKWNTGDIISLAYDSDADTIMFRQNGGTWTSAISTTPVTDPYYLYMYFADSVGTGCQLTLNTGDTAFAYTPPSGYVGPDAS